MATHFLVRNGASTLCNSFDPEDDYTINTDAVSCIECRFHDKIQEAWEEYVSQPSNFGEDNALVQFAERDAFFAGAYFALKQAVPF